jgi:hypothetical protein
MAEAPDAGGAIRQLLTQLKLSLAMRIAVTLIAASMLAITALLALFVMRSVPWTPFRWGPSDYAVLLTNGHAYYGKILSVDSEFVLMENVFYLRQRSDGEKKDLTLVKRGSEFHRPARMYINTRQVQFIEPVGTESELAKLIAQVK